MRKIILHAVFFLALCLPGMVKAADLETMNLAGLTEFVAQNKGKAVMVNFFATWCPPCAMEIPDLIAVNKEQKDKSVVIIGLSVDEDKNKVPAFLKKFGVDYPVFLAGDDVVQAFGITSIPHNIFYAPTGKIMLANSGIIEKEMLLEIFAKLLEQK